MTESSHQQQNIPRGDSQPAVFLDRDGTLIKDVGFLADATGIELFPDTVSALLQLQKNHTLFVITNQSGVGDGLLKMEDVHKVNAKLAGLLRDHGITIQEWYVCPHSKSENCSCRKPKIQFLEQAVHDHGIDLQVSYSIGDHPHDATLGESLGVKGVYLLTGHGRNHQPELPPGKPVFETIGEAAEWITTTGKNTA
ncbi:MAG: HAD-IIIA family hydrolase [Lentisphaeria bacterium]